MEETMSEFTTIQEMLDRYPRPWSLEENAPNECVRDADGHAVMWDEEDAGWPRVFIGELGALIVAAVNKY